MEHDDEGQEKLRREQERQERNLMKEAMRQAMADPELRRQEKQHEKDMREVEMKVIGAEKFDIGTPSSGMVEPRTPDGRPWENRGSQSSQGVVGYDIAMEDDAAPRHTVGDLVNWWDSQAGKKRRAEMGVEDLDTRPHGYQTLPSDKEVNENPNMTDLSNMQCGHDGIDSMSGRRHQSKVCRREKQGQRREAGRHVLGWACVGA